MLDLLQETLLYIEEQNAWLHHLKIIIAEKEHKYKILHSKISCQIIEEVQQKEDTNLNVCDETELNLTSLKAEVLDENVLVEIKENCPSREEDRYYDDMSQQLQIEGQNDEAGPMEDDDGESQTTEMEQLAIAESCVANERRLVLPDEIPNEVDYEDWNVQEASSAVSVFPIKEHIANTGKKYFVCPFCKRTFKQRVHLRDHIRLHTGEKPFSCDYCNKSFAQKSNLKSHVRTHTGEKPFRCNYCSQWYSQRGNLNAHVIAAHGGGLS